MALEISDTCLAFSIAKEIWEALKHTYSKARVYEIRIRATSSKQGRKIVMEYANELKSLQQELDHYR